MAPKIPSVITADGCINPRWLRLVHSCKMALDYGLTIGPLEILYLKFRRHERVNRTTQSWRHVKACHAVREKTGKDFDCDYSLQAYADAGAEREPANIEAILDEVKAIYAAAEVV